MDTDGIPVESMAASEKKTLASTAGRQGIPALAAAAVVMMGSGFGCKGGGGYSTIKLFMVLWEGGEAGYSTISLLVGLLLLSLVSSLLLSLSSEDKHGVGRRNVEGGEC